MAVGSRPSRDSRAYPPLLTLARSDFSKAVIQSAGLNFFRRTGSCAALPSIGATRQPVNGILSAAVGLGFAIAHTHELLA